MSVPFGILTAINVIHDELRYLCAGYLPWSAVPDPYLFLVLDQELYYQ